MELDYQPSGTTVRRVTFTSAVSSCILSMLALTAVATHLSVMPVGECLVIAMSLLHIFLSVIIVMWWRHLHSSVKLTDMLAYWHCNIMCTFKFCV